MMMEGNVQISLENILSAYEVVKSSPLCVRTPVIRPVPSRVGIDFSVDLYLKLENMQVTGSFKTRGLSNQLKHTLGNKKIGNSKLITMSSGNYGKSFSYAAQHLNLQVKVLIPETAPKNRVEIIKSYGAEVETMPTANLLPTIRRYEEDFGMHFLHPFDDVNLITGHASAGLELLEEVPDVDIVLVCCGGGGLVAGIAAAIKSSGRPDCRVYAVEPEGANTMFESFKIGQPVTKAVKTIAAGLAAPFAGEITYQVCRSFVDDVLLVSDDQIISGVKALYNSGLVVEPGGAAAFAALQSGIVPDVKDKKVVVVITGGNVSSQELCDL